MKQWQGVKRGKELLIKYVKRKMREREREKKKRRERVREKKNRNPQGTSYSFKNLWQAWRGKAVQRGG